MKRLGKILHLIFIPPASLIVYLAALLIGTWAFFVLSSAITELIAANSWKWWHVSRWDIVQQEFRIVGWYGFIPADCLGSYLATIFAFKLAPNKKVVTAYLVAGILLCLHIGLFVLLRVDLTCLSDEGLSVTAHLVCFLVCTSIAIMQIARMRQSFPDIHQACG